MQVGGYDLLIVKECLKATLPQWELDTITDEQIDQKIQWVPNSSFLFWSTEILEVLFGEDPINLSVQNLVYSSSTQEIELPK